MHTSWKSSLVRTIGAGINHRAAVPVCFAAALLVRLLYILLIRTTPDVADSKWYIDVATSIANGDGAAINGAPTASWPVGYALFLAACFKIFGLSIGAAKAINIALYLGSMFFAYRIAQRTFNKAVATATLIIMAIYPNQLAYTPILISEILYLFLLLFAIHLFLYSTWRSLILSGIVFGLLVYVKPQGFFLPALLIVLFRLPAVKDSPWTFIKTALLQIALCYALIGIIIAPWTIRNYQVFGRMTLINTNGGTNLFLGNHPAVETRFGLPFLPDGVLAGILAKHGETVSSDEVLVSDILGQETIAFMKANPARVIARWPQKILHLWAMDVEGGRLNEREILQIDSATKMFLYYFKVVGQLYYLLIMAGFLVFVWHLLRKKIPWTPSTWMVLVIMGYFTGISLVFHGESRYHFPLMPLIIMQACAGAAFALRPAERSAQPVD
jgi:4-amino-4-deoxy-L-arabinose transferase-like glycosyltransferase